MINEFKEGDRVKKARRYSEGTYCKHGGDESDVPIGTEGKITKVIEEGQKIEVMFDNGIEWNVDVSELDLVKKSTQKPDNLVRYMVYDLKKSDGQKGMLYSTQKEMKEKMKEVVHDGCREGRIIGYKLTPIYEAEESVKFKKL